MFKDWRDASLLDWLIGVSIVAVIVFLFSGAARADILKCDEVRSSNSSFDKAAINAIMSGNFYDINLVAYSPVTINIVCKTNVGFTPSSFYMRSRPLSSVTYTNTSQVCTANPGNVSYDNPCFVQSISTTFTRSVISGGKPYSIYISYLPSSAAITNFGTSDPGIDAVFTGIQMGLNPFFSVALFPNLTTSLFGGTFELHATTQCVSSLAVGCPSTGSQRIYSDYYIIPSIPDLAGGLSETAMSTTVVDTGKTYSTNTLSQSTPARYYYMSLYFPGLPSDFRSFDRGYSMSYALYGNYLSTCSVDCSSAADTGAPVCISGASSVAGCGLVQPVSDETPFPEIIKGGAYTTSEALAYLRRVCVDVTVDACRAVLSKYHDYKYSIPDWFSGLDIYYQEKYK